MSPTHLAPRTANGSVAMTLKSIVRKPKMCAWQSQSPGMTTAARLTSAASSAGASAAGPA
jgi:hypothetical protein